MPQGKDYLSNKWFQLQKFYVNLNDIDIYLKYLGWYLKFIFDRLRQSIDLEPKTYMIALTINYIQRKIVGGFLYAPGFERKRVILWFEWSEVVDTNLST